MSCKNETRFVSSYFNSKRKESISLLFSNLKSVIAYDVNFEDILKTHRVIETDDEESKNWRKLQLLMRRKRASVLSENHEIKSIQVTVRRSFNENSVSFSVFPRIFLVSRVNICNTLKKHWNHQWTHWISSYTNHSSKVASSQSNYVIEYHIKLFLDEVIWRLQEQALVSRILRRAERDIKRDERCKTTKSAQRSKCDLQHFKSASDDRWEERFLQ